ncbi:MAG: YicC/YloC family endoribonuclease [Pseudomonadota bacterium]
MTVYSMTGYAVAGTEGADGNDGAANLTVEARSVNGRFLDLSLRLPDELRGLEPALRDLAGARLRRGKVELRIAAGREAADPWPQPGADQLARLAALQAEVTARLPDARPRSVNEALAWGRSAAAAPRADEAVLAAARACLAGLAEARAREGDRLAATLRERIAQLRQLAGRAGPLVPSVVQRQQQRFVERWNEALHAVQGAAGVAAAAVQERALAEAAAYAIRIDVAEELSRLQAHLDEIDRLLVAGGVVGKRLVFLIQVLHREANKLGSMSAAVELTGISVDMKVLIEQMREQVQNIE